MRNEVEAALESTTEMLSQVTRLLALVSAPGLETATVRYVEVLLLQPSVVMVVTITSTGAVARSSSPSAHRSTGSRRLSERVPERAAHRGRARHAPPPPPRSRDPGLSPRERAFVDAVRPAFLG